MKKKKNNNLVKTATSVSLSFSVLKLFQNSSDPYTRIVLGSGLGVSVLVFGGADFKALGIGVLLGSSLQGTEIFKGGRITKNEFTETIFTLHESEGIKELTSGMLPDYNCDGFTYKGLNGVIKIADGVHCKISKEGKIRFTGVGSIVNKVKSGGFHDLEWCQKTGDSRWVKLYEKSV